MKRMISEYSSFAMLVLCFIFLFLEHNLFAFLLLIIWYLQCGMVGLAYRYSQKRDIKTSNILLKLSVSATLTPSKKAFYYWTKAINIILADSAAYAQAYEFAQKVRVENLYKDNNKSLFHLFIAALLNDMGEKEEALRHVETSNQLPHEEFINKAIEALRQNITGDNTL